MAWQRAAAIAAVTVAMGMLASCGSSSEDDRPGVPTGVSVRAGDTAVTVTWNQEPGLTYWIFSAQASGISRDTYDQYPQARIVFPARSPQTIGGLTNGATYSFIINATRDGGPAGPATGSLSAVPRLAGAVWTAGTALGNVNLNAVTFGFGRYVAVGAGGAVFTSTSTTAASGTWAAATSGTPAELNGVVAGASLVAVGAGGTILTSTDGLAWTAVTSGVTTALNDVTLGGTAYVAVGSGGVILRSTDATTWAAVTSGTTADLFGVNFVNGQFVATGAGGTLLTSSDGTTWTARTTGTTQALRSVAVSADRYVAVGAGGTILNSPDLVTWTAVASGTTQTLRRVVYGTQFIAAGDGGTALYGNGATWAAAGTGTTADLRGLMRGALYNYVAVGTGGANLNAD
jgi:hypothetical protein